MSLKFILSIPDSIKKRVICFTWFQLEINQYDILLVPSCIPASCQKNILALFEKAPFLKHDKNMSFFNVSFLPGLFFFFFFLIIILGGFWTC